MDYKASGTDSALPVSKPEWDRIEQEAELTGVCRAAVAAKGALMASPRLTTSTVATRCTGSCGPRTGSRRTSAVELPGHRRFLSHTDPGG
jgi:hypothetical protein